MSHAESHYTPIKLESRKENRFVEVCGAGIQGIYFRELRLHKPFFSLLISPNSVLWEFVEAEFRLSTKQICGDQIPRMGFTWWDRIGKAQYIERREAVCDPC